MDSFNDFRIGDRVVSLDGEITGTVVCMTLKGKLPLLIQGDESTQGGPRLFPRTLFGTSLGSNANPVKAFKLKSY